MKIETIEGDDLTGCFPYLLAHATDLIKKKNEWGGCGMGDVLFGLYYTAGQNTTAAMFTEGELTGDKDNVVGVVFRGVRGKPIFELPNSQFCVLAALAVTDSVREAARLLDCSPPAVCKHITELVESGHVVAVPGKKENMTKYTLSPASLEHMSQYAFLDAKKRL